MLTRWLIVRGDGDVRVYKTQPSPRDLRKNEVAFKLLIDVPPEWAKVSAQEIRITMPAVPQMTAEVTGDEPIIGERVEIVEPQEATP